MGVYDVGMRIRIKLLIYILDKQKNIYIYTHATENFDTYIKGYILDEKNCLNKLKNSLSFFRSRVKFRKNIF